MLNVRDISEVLSELEEQEEPKEESSNGSNKFVYNHDYHDDRDVKKKGPTTVLNTDRNKPSKDGQLRLSQRSLGSTSTTHSS